MVAPNGVSPGKEAMSRPLDIRDLLRSTARLRKERAKPVRIAVLVDVGAPSELVDAVESALRPQTGSARLHVEAVSPGEVHAVDDAADAVIALAGPGDTLRPSLERAREKLVPTVAVAFGEEPEAVARRLGQPALDIVCSGSTDELVEELGRWLAERIGSKRLALAANFPFVRRAVAREAVRATAFQNGVIGGVAFIPGADMPLMTANQAKMILQIAAAYGEPLGPERVKELLAVVGAAFTFRAVARQVAGLVPVIGWAVKAGVGYSGTLAMGLAAIDYFEHGGDVGALVERLKDLKRRGHGSTALSDAGDVVREPEAS